LSIIGRFIFSRKFSRSPRPRVCQDIFLYIFGLSVESSWESTKMETLKPSLNIYRKAASALFVSVNVQAVAVTPDQPPAVWFE
jgi:hypothetical protein